MSLTDLNLLFAIILGSIGTLLGIVNLIRDINRNMEKISISRCLVNRIHVTEERQRFANAKLSELGSQSTTNQHRNIGYWSKDSLEQLLRNGDTPNLVGFEISNESNKSLYLDNVGLTSYENRNKYISGGYDAIQSLKAESDNNDLLEVKPNSKFTTYCLIDNDLIKLIAEGYIYPFLETQTKKKRIHSTSETLEYFSEWINKS